MPVDMSAADDMITPASTTSGRATFIVAGDRYRTEESEGQYSIVHNQRTNDFTPHVGVDDFTYKAMEWVTRRFQEWNP